MLHYERALKRQGRKNIIGVDEAGRGPLAGPVVAAAVLLKTYAFENRIDDSKKLSPSQRHAAFLEISSKSLYGIGIVNERIIDLLNIRCATKIAMEEAVEKVLSQIEPEGNSQTYALIDGNMSLDIACASDTIVRGDARCLSIAAASIIAKVTRDRIMDIYDRIFPRYGFISHKGYPTARHRSVLKRLGATFIHRKSFCGVSK
jgi:ribonuclease HII